MERERERKEAERKKKIQLNHPIGGTGEKRKLKIRYKVEKPADPPRATVFGRTVRKPEDNESTPQKGSPDGKTMQSTGKMKPASKR